MTVNPIHFARLARIVAPAMMVIFALFAAPQAKAAEGGSGQASYKLGAQSFESGDYQEAVRQFWLAVEAEPENALFRHRLGLAYYSLRKIPEADEALKKAVDLDGSNALYHHDYGWVSHVLGRHNEAVDHLNKAIELAPKEAKYRHALAMIFLETDMEGPAERLLLETAEIDPGYAKTFITLGNLYNYRQKWDKATEAIEKGLALKIGNGDRKEGLKMLAVAREGLGEYQKALDAANEALKLAPNSSDLKALAGRLQERAIAAAPAPAASASPEAAQAPAQEKPEEKMEPPAQVAVAPAAPEEPSAAERIQISRRKSQPSEEEAKTANDNEPEPELAQYKAKAETASSAETPDKVKKSKSDGEAKTEESKMAKAGADIFDETDKMIKQMRSRIAKEDSAEDESKELTQAPAQEKAEARQEPEEKTEEAAGSEMAEAVEEPEAIAAAAANEEEEEEAEPEAAGEPAMEEQAPEEVEAAPVEMAAAPAETAEEKPVAEASDRAAEKAKDKDKGKRKNKAEKEDKSAAKARKAEKKEKAAAKAEKEEEKKAAKKEKVETAKRELAWESRKQLMDAYGEIGFGNFAYAERLTDEALRLDRQNVDALILKGLLQLKGGNAVGALSSARDAALLSPKTSFAHSLEGQALEALGREEEAAGAFQAALELDGNEPSALAHLGTIALRHAEYKDALPMLREGMERGFASPGVLNNLAMAELREGKDKEAKGRLALAVSKDRGHPAILANVDFLFYAQGDEASAWSFARNAPASEAWPPKWDKDAPMPVYLSADPEALSFADHFRDHWKQKRIVVLPFEGPAGTNAWKENPADDFSLRLAEALRETGRFEVQLVTQEELRRGDYGLAKPARRLTEDERMELLGMGRDLSSHQIARLGQLLAADLLVHGQLTRPETESLSKEYYGGLKKKATHELMVSAYGTLYDATKEKVLYEGEIMASAELEGVKESEYSAQHRRALEVEATENLLNETLKMIEARNLILDDSIVLASGASQLADGRRPDRKEQFKSDTLNMQAIDAVE